jgi:hypothetical protein
MAQYATASELASYLQKDLDTSTANLVLTLASTMFEREADTVFAPTTTTWTWEVNGWPILELPFKPVTAVSAVRVNGVAISGWALRVNTLYRAAGFGYPYMWPPDQIQVDLTYGYASAPDDVKAAVLEMAAQAYDVPVSALASEQIDDYAARYVTAGGGLQLTQYAQTLAAGYRGLLVS